MPLQQWTVMIFLISQLMKMLTVERRITGLWLSSLILNKDIEDMMTNKDEYHDKDIQTVSMLTNNITNWDTDER